MTKIETPMKLKLLRTLHGYKQSEVADVLGITRQSMAGFENEEERFIQDDYKVKLSKLYNVDINTLFFDKDMRNFCEKLVQSLLEKE